MARNVCDLAVRAKRTMIFAELVDSTGQNSRRMLFGAICAKVEWCNDDHYRLVNPSVHIELNDDTGTVRELEFCEDDRIDASLVIDNRNKILLLRVAVPSFKHVDEAVVHAINVDGKDYRQQFVTLTASGDAFVRDEPFWLPPPPTVV